MVDVVKAFADVTLHNPVAVRLEGEKLHSFQRHRRIPHWSKTIGVSEKLCLKNGFQHDSHALLDDSIPYGWNPQWTFFGFSWFVDVDPSYLLRLKMAKRFLNIVDNPCEWFLQIIFLHGFVINTRSFAALIAFDIVDCGYNSGFC